MKCYSNFLRQDVRPLEPNIATAHHVLLTAHQVDCISGAVRFVTLSIVLNKAIVCGIMQEFCGCVVIFILETVVDLRVVITAADWIIVRPAAGSIWHICGGVATEYSQEIQSLHSQLHKNINRPT